MLEVQKYLQEHKYPCLEQDFGIRVKKHDTLPLYILNYHQINSPKNHPISNECRGLVLDNNYNLVARAFPRFFNWDEVKKGQEKFNWLNYRAFSKEDGTLILLYNWNGRWFANTRGSFGDGKVGDSEYTWEQLVCKALCINNLQDIDSLFMLDQHYTYIFELVSPYNKVVTQYDSTKLYFLSAFEKHTGEEVDWTICKQWMIGLHVYYPQEYLFTTLNEILRFIKDKSKENPTWEGVVIRDNNNNLRYKIKSETYLALHRLKNNGNVASLDNIITLILNGEEAEVLTYFPELEPQFTKWGRILDYEYDNLIQVFFDSSNITSQKGFAQYIMPRTHFSALLFQIRKEKGYSASEYDVKNLWLKSHDLIVKVLEKNYVCV